MGRSNAKQSLRRMPSATGRLSDGGRRDRVLRSAIVVLANRGYVGCTVREITQVAGIARTTFYGLFRDKDDVFNTILAETSRQIISRMQGAQASVEEWPEKVCAGLRAMLDFFARDPDLARVAFVEAQIAGPRAVSLVQGAMRQYTANLGPSFSARGGPLSTPPASVSEQIAGAIYFTMYDAVACGNARRLPDLLPLVTEIALSPYMPEEAIRDILDKPHAEGS